MIGPDEAAAAVLGALESGRQIAPLTDADPGFDLARAGAAAVEVVRRRIARGERVVGHKLGFTNRRIWDEYGVRAPIWGALHDSTTAPLGDAIELAPLLEPKIEPEILFRLSRAPPPDPDLPPAELIACASHIALGFEVVQSVFPGWRFRAPDTLAGFAQHGLLRHGPFAEISPRDRGAWAARLADFRVTLLRDGAVADTGHSATVLGGGPVEALGHLGRLLAGLPGAPAAAAGQLFTTGTLTRALPVAPGQEWQARVEGLSLAPISLRFF